MVEPSDSALMERYALGDGRAFEQLFRRYEGRAYAFFLRRTRSPDRAHDLYQDLFLRIHRFRERFDPAQRFEPWFFRIAYRVYLDALRREHLVTDPLDEESTSFVDGPDAEGLAIARQSVRLVLGRLPREQQAVLLSAKVDGRAYGEIARELGKTADAVKQLASRAMRRLRSSNRGA